MPKKDGIAFLYAKIGVIALTLSKDKGCFILYLSFEFSFFVCALTEKYTVSQIAK